jgi:hypothetical protein
LNADIDGIAASAECTVGTPGFLALERSNVEAVGKQGRRRLAAVGATD